MYIAYLGAGQDHPRKWWNMWEMDESKNRQ